MESMLYEAALEGNTTTLLKLFEQDPLILDRVIFLNRLDHKTPFHVAAYLGHVNFVKEILCRKPELASEMCLARDEDGRNPLHLAAMKGRIDVLKELVRFRPLAASAATLCGETILHLCVKHQQLEELKLLLENSNELHHLLNSKDDYGMTILHLAVADKQIETIEFLTSTKVEVNALTANGFTALDILAQCEGDVNYPKIRRLLKKAKAVYGNFHMQDDWLEKMRSAILVVASLIATVAFQAAVNPPHHSPLEEKNEAVAPAPLTLARSEQIYRTDWISDYLISLKESFILFNTIAFLASVSTILMLISGLPLNRKVALWVLLIILWAACTALTFTYMTALKFLYKGLYSPASSYIVFIWTCVAGLIILIHIVRGTIKSIKYFKELVTKPRGRLDRPYRAS